MFSDIVAMSDIIAASAALHNEYNYVGPQLLESQRDDYTLDSNMDMDFA